MRLCGGLCRLSNAVRLFHILLTFFILYILLKNPHSELNKAWRSKDASFFVLIFLLSVSLLLYLIASFIDPGYLPKVEPSLLDFTTTNKLTEDAPMDSLDSPHVELSLDALTDSDNLMASKRAGTGRFCRVCHTCQPMRSKHCYQCGRCVRRFDHHCPWLGNCVGERNHRFFWMFLACETALLDWGVWIAWTAIDIEGDTLDWLRANVLVFLSLFVVFGFSILVGLLLLYHSYLMLSGQTTWEQASRHRIPYLKDLQELSNPFDEGSCCNMVAFVCSGLRDWEQVYTSTTIPFRTKSNA